MTTATAPAPAAFVIDRQMLDRQIGFSLYVNRHPVGCCANAQQIAGWWAALDAEATCALCDTMSASGNTPARIDKVLESVWR